MNAKNDKPHFNSDEASEYLNLSKSYLYKLTHRKLIPFSKPLGKKLYFKKDDLDKWLFEKTVKPVRLEDNNSELCPKCKEKKLDCNCEKKNNQEGNTHG